MSGNFVNPYNFIPLSAKSEERNKERRSLQNETERLYTGKIHYSVETVTPLFIPNTSNDRIFGVNAKHQDQAEYHKSYDFFSYHDLSRCTPGIEQPYYAPVIPGSEMRGAIRSIYEAITDSCLSALDEDEIFSRRTPERYKAGLLTRNKNGSYILKEAADYICRNSDDFSDPYYDRIPDVKDGTSVRYKFSSLNTNRKPYAKKIVDIVTEPHAPVGYIIKGQAGPVLPKPNKGAKCDACPVKTKAKCDKNGGKECYLLMKHNAHVFVELERRERGKASGVWKVSDQNISMLDSVLEIYKENSADAYKEYRGTWEKFKKGQLDVIPVYYSVLQAADRKEDILLAPACVTREVYHNTLRLVLGNHYLPCRDKEHLCPTCQLFGTVNKGLAKASAIRFSDLRAEEKEDNRDYYREDKDRLMTEGMPSDELLTLEELGQPKPSSMEFYLKKPEVKLGPGEKLAAWTFDYYITVDQNGKPNIYFYTPDIAGRKFYWHSTEAAKRQLTLNTAKKKETEWSKDHPDQDKYITKRNKTIRPVRSGITFYGELYFNQITKAQLEQLIAVLNMSKSGQYGIKIGGGKPLGLGSVKIKVQQVDYRTVFADGDRLKYQSEVYEFQDIDISNVCDDSLLKVFDFHAVNEHDYEVAYPFVESAEDEGYKWFAENREAFVIQGKGDHIWLDVNSIAKGPSARIQIPYRKYMEALRPKLVDSGFGMTSQKTGKMSNAEKGNKISKSFEIGKEYEGTVFGYNPSGIFAKVRLDVGGTASFKDASHKHENRHVKLRYEGKDSRDYDKWSPVDDH